MCPCIDLIPNHGHPGNACEHACTLVADINFCSFVHDCQVNRLKTNTNENYCHNYSIHVIRSLFRSSGHFSDHYSCISDHFLDSVIHDGVCILSHYRVYLNNSCDYY